MTRGELPADFLRIFIDVAPQRNETPAAGSSPWRTGVIIRGVRLTPRPLYQEIVPTSACMRLRCVD